MEAFSDLLEQLYFTSSHNAKSALIIDYLRQTPDPDRGWALAAMAGTLRFDFFKRNTIKQLMLERIDPVLFDLSYDYVGEMSETVAHLWPDVPYKPAALPGLAQIVDGFMQAKRHEVKPLLVDYLNQMNAAQRWALIKLGTRGLRIGVSARSVKQILARYGDKPVTEIEALWHGVEPPYTELLHWLEGRAAKPDISQRVTFHPVMLAHPVDETTLENLSPGQWQVEHKYDGIRVQLVCTPHGKALFSRTGDDISGAFPDLLETVTEEGVIDGELLVMQGSTVESFNRLQQRLNKKKPTKKLMSELPAGLIAYDILADHEQDYHQHPLHKRRIALQHYLQRSDSNRLHLSQQLPADTLSELRQRYAQACQDTAVEGLMLKRSDSLYVPGRPKGQWFKWKREPRLVDAVLMYAQRGHGKRSSFYSDFTFGAWQGETLLPIGKAYSGFTDEELKKLDNWVRRNTTGRFGPVRELAKALVIEVAFDAAHPSNRHKSGVALRFPRFHRIRWDKPAAEADTLDTVLAMIE